MASAIDGHSRCHGGADLPVDLSILSLIVEIKNCHSWPLRWLYWGSEVDLLVDLPILALIVEISNCHSSPLGNSTWGANLLVDLPILSLIVEMSILLFLATRWLYWWWSRVDVLVDLLILALIVEISNWHFSLLGVMGVDLPADLPILALIVENSNYHSLPLDDSTGGVG